VFPLLLVGFWTALRRSAQLALSLLKDASSWTSLAALAIILTLLSFTSLWLAATMGGLNALWGRAAGSLPWSKDVLPAYAWISTHTPPDSIVIARRDCVLYLNTGRASFFPYPSPRIYYWPSSNPLGDYSSLTGIAHKYGARYVLVSDNSTERVLHPMLFPHNELLDPRLYRKAFSSGSASVYEILPE